MHNDHEHNDIHDQGLQFDLRTLMHRRRLLGALGGAAAFVLVGCGDDDALAATSTPGGSATTGTAPTAAGQAPSGATATVSPIPTSPTPLSSCLVAPEETTGPFPGNGSNGPNVLDDSGIVRSDIRSSYDISTNTAAGVPLVIELTIVDTANGCAPMAGAAVYLWHCDRAGDYSLYTLPAENYLRGVQEADANGVVRFQSIFPGCYSGRWPHAHFEVYPNLAQTTSSSNKIATSQLALPDDVCATVYAIDGYDASARNLQQVSLDSDTVFRDGWDLQMAATSGDVSTGYTSKLTVGV